MISRRRIPPLNHVQHVADGRARGRGDQADALRISGQRTFSFRREQAFRREFLLQFLKGGLQRAHALQFHRAHDELVLPARLINRHVALQQNLLSVREQLALRPRRVPRNSTQLNCAAASLSVK